MRLTHAGHDPARTTMIGLGFARLSMASAAFGLLLMTHALWVDLTYTEGAGSYTMPSVALVIALVTAAVSLLLLPRSNARHSMAVWALRAAAICLGVPLLFFAWVVVALSFTATG